MKLSVLGVTTFGAYVVYWFYRNWWAIRLIERRPGIMPAWRAGLMPLWGFSCFRRLALIAGQAPVHAAVAAALLATPMLLLVLIAFAAQPRASVSLLVFVPVLLVNVRLRRFKRAHGVQPSRRERFTIWNWLWAVPVGFLLGLSWLVLLLSMQQGMPVPR